PQGGGTPVAPHLVGDSPSKPFGGPEELAWSPDGRTLYFALREAGRIEALSTNLDIFAVPSDASAPPVNLTDANDATDNLPAVSPDGRTLAYFAMARPTYEADRQLLMLRDLASGQTRALTQAWDRSVGSIEWAKDGKSLLVTAEDTLEQPVFRVDSATGRVTRLTGDGHFGNVHALPGGAALATMNSIMAPDDLYRIDSRGRVTQLTSVNRGLLAQLDPVVFNKFSFAGANNDRVWGWTLKPVMNRMLPMILLVHGGPQGTFSNSWSYRWNPRVFSGPGYGVVSVDFHGSTGYGQAFTDAINRNWGGWPLEDLQKGLAYAVAHDPQLDGNRACAAGGSYGGYMMNWIEGRWPDRFRCIVQHDGVFDARAMAYETEELWFDEWEHGGHPYYEAPAEYERWNPVNTVQNWKTPQLVITSENDFRIPYTQGIAAFTALQRRDIPSRLLVFPDENHWVLKPKNSIQWYDEVFGWFGRWLGMPPPPTPAPPPSAASGTERGR
ncbi:MAG: prolyl oligopeptidase family serine peptidase, partial [Sphingomicrobium sp.]